MSEDKMREEFKKWWKDRQSADELFAPSDIAFFAWKACAAIKDAEIVKERQLCTEYIEQRNEAYKEIAARDLMIKELREVTQQTLDAHRLSTKFAPDNVEEAEKQLDRIKKAGIAAREALAKSEHHDSRALEKKLLEAEMKGLKSVWGTIPEYSDRVYNALQAKLDGMNKE